MPPKKDSRQDDAMEARTEGQDRPGVDVEALEETMEEVVETLAVAEQAAEFVQARSNDEDARRRAATVQEQAEAMLDAAEESGAGSPQETSRTAPPTPSGRTLH